MENRIPGKTKKKKRKKIRSKTKYPLATEFLVEKFQSGSLARTKGEKGIGQKEREIERERKGERKKGESERNESTKVPVARAHRANLHFH